MKKYIRGSFEKGAMVVCVTLCAFLLVMLTIVYIELRIRQKQDKDQTVNLEQNKESVDDTYSESTASYESTFRIETETKGVKPTETEQATAHLASTESVSTNKVSPISGFSYANGTTSANIYNGGFVASDETNCYYKGEAGLLYVSSLDGSDSKCLLEKDVWYINVQNGWIYFKNNTDQCMARIRTDGTDYQILCYGNVHEINVHGDRIFYGTDTELHSMNIDGSDDICLISGTTWYLNVTDDALYFCLVGDNRSLCRCNHNGSGLITIVPSQVYDVMVFGNQIYYTYGKDERYLYAMDKTTFESRQVNNSYTRWVNADSRFIYFTNYEGYTDEGVGYGNTLYRVSFDGTISKQTLSDTIKGICIQNDTLYYMDTDDSCKSITLS